MAERHDVEFAKIATRSGVLTRDQVRDCRSAQKQMASLGIRKTLEEVALEKKLLRRKDVVRIHAALHKDGDFPVIGGYEILGQLGKGGMGAVYKARQRSMRRLVALKMLPASLANDQVSLARFQREAKAVAKLNHPNIVRAIDMGEADGHHYLAIEFVDGKDVESLLREQGVIEEAYAIKVAIQVAEALRYASELHIIHRDVKPSNILITRDGTAKLTDFGLVKQLGEGDLSLTKSGAAVGTPYYMPPEQAQARDDVDVRADIYSLGATLYHMVAGEVPFQGMTTAAILTKLLTTDLVPPHEREPSVSENLSCVIQRMMALHREERYQTPAEVIEELRRVQRNESSNAMKDLGDTRGLDLAALAGEAEEHVAGENEENGEDGRLAESDPDPAVLAPTDSSALAEGLAALAAAEDDVEQPMPAEQPERQRVRIKPGGEVAVEPERPSEGDSTEGRSALVSVPGMVYVAGGVFVMGNNGGRANERPEHSRDISGFYIDAVPVTNAQYSEFVRACKRDAPFHWQGGLPLVGRENHPVVGVTWLDAAAYVQWAGKRLPTEAEWEKAARGTEGRAYPWGNEFDRDRCNSIWRLAGRDFPNSKARSEWLRRWEESEDGRTILALGGNTTAVGAFENGGSPCGCLGMAGNVMEWTADWYDAYPGSDCKESRFGQRYRVVRGGSWRSTAKSVRCAARNFSDPKIAFSFVGFRCARDAE